MYTTITVSYSVTVRSLREIERPEPQSRSLYATRAGGGSGAGRRPPQKAAGWPQIMADARPSTAGKCSNETWILHTFAKLGEMIIHNANIAGEVRRILAWQPKNPRSLLSNVAQRL